MNATDQLSCFTIGHSNHAPEKFIALLKQHAIACVADVRSSPYSRHNPQFNREVIKAALHASAIAYVFLGDRLGARQTGPELLYPDGRMVDFKKVRASDNFKKGIDRVLKGLQQGHRIALMCAEKNPFDCHRFVLISPALAQKGIRLSHILADGELVEQETLEENLLADCNPGWRQSSLFEKPRSRAEALVQAYNNRNREMGYTLPEEELR